jgi:hypothetical protein
MIANTDQAATFLLQFAALEPLRPVLYYATIPGGFGGAASALYAIQRGKYANNKYVQKIMIEIFGAMIVASFVSYYLWRDQPFLAFASGLTWSAIIQVVRRWITRMVEAALGEKADEEGQRRN